MHELDSSAAAERVQSIKKGRAFSVDTFIPIPFFFIDLELSLLTTNYHQIIVEVIKNYLCLSRVIGVYQKLSDDIRAYPSLLKIIRNYLKFSRFITKTIGFEPTIPELEVQWWQKLHYYISENSLQFPVPCLLVH